jgi:hypothetical protein
MKANDRHTYLQGYLDGFGDVVLVHDREQEQLPRYKAMVPQERWRRLTWARALLRVRALAGFCRTFRTWTKHALST